MWSVPDYLQSDLLLSLSAAMLAGQAPQLLSAIR